MPDRSEASPLMSGARYVAASIAAPERVQRCIHGIESNLQSDPGVVFDHAKALIETTCKTLLKERGYQSNDDWKVQQLAKFTLKAVVQVPSGHPDPEAAKARLETTLQSLIGIVQGVGELRNLDGEIGHGKEADRVVLTTCHAEFAARAADAVVKFLTESHLCMFEFAAADQLTYSANPDFNEYIDDAHLPVQIFLGQYKPSDILFQVDRQAYRDALNDYLLESKADEQ